MTRAACLLLTAACAEPASLAFVQPRGAADRAAIAFASATGPAVVKPAGAASVDVPVRLVRTPSWSTDGALSTHLRVTSGPCAPTEQVVGFADGDAAPQVARVQATDVGTCVLRLVLDDAATDPTAITTTLVEIVPELTGVHGAIAFASASNPDLWKPAGAASVDVPLTIVRTPAGASTGAVSTDMQVVAGPCDPYYQTVGFADGEAGSKVITLRATASGTCAIRVINGDADASAGAVTLTAVSILAEDPSTLRGAIAFPSNRLADAIWSTSRITWVEIPVTLVRAPLGSRNGELTTQLQVVSGPCEPAAQTVGFQDGESGSRLILTTTGNGAIRATATGECHIRVSGGDADTSTGAITSTVVRILSAPDPSVPCINGAGQLVPYPANSRVQELLPGGSNNYAYDYPEGAITIFPLVMSRPIGDANGDVQTTPCLGSLFQFASTAANVGPLWVQSQIGVYEIAFSKCPGDFEYYKTDAASYFCEECTGENHRWFRSCGVQWGADSTVSWRLGSTNFYSCGIPEGEQWYMNWRYLGGTVTGEGWEPSPCPHQNGAICGQTFYMPDWCSPFVP
jgi:hypothetical protein